MQMIERVESFHSIICGAKELIEKGFLFRKYFYAEFFPIISWHYDVTLITFYQDQTLVNTCCVSICFDPDTISNVDIYFFESIFSLTNLKSFPDRFSDCNSFIRF